MLLSMQAPSSTFIKALLCLQASRFLTILKAAGSVPSEAKHVSAPRRGGLLESRWECVDQGLHLRRVWFWLRLLPVMLLVWRILCALQVTHALLPTSFH